MKRQRLFENVSGVGNDAADMMNVDLTSCLGDKDMAKILAENNGGDDGNGDVAPAPPPPPSPPPASRLTTGTTPAAAARRTSA